MNAPRPLPCCSLCGEPSPTLYEHHGCHENDRLELCGACLDREMTPAEEREPAFADDEDNHGPDYAPDVHGRW